MADRHNHMVGVQLAQSVLRDSGYGPFWISTTINVLYAEVYTTEEL